MIKGLEEELRTLKESIVTLDASVLEATIQRKKENSEYTEVMSDNTAAVELMNFAKNRLNKFYNPKLYKPPPKRELSEEEKIYSSMGGEVEGAAAAAGLLQRDAPAPPPEAPSYKKKGEESTGVIAMMDNLVKELDKEMTEAEVEEKDAQEDYEKYMKDSADKRAEDSKAVTDKSAAKAEMETELQALTDTKTATEEELTAT